MTTPRVSLVCLLVALVAAPPLAQAPAEKIDLAMIARIRDEGMNRSQVMDHISWLSDSSTRRSWRCSPTTRRCATRGCRASR